MKQIDISNVVKYLLSQMNEHKLYPMDAINRFIEMINTDCIPEHEQFVRESYGRLGVYGEAIVLDVIAEMIMEGRL